MWSSLFGVLLVKLSFIHAFCSDSTSEFECHRQQVDFCEWEDGSCQSNCKKLDQRPSLCLAEGCQYVLNRCLFKQLSPFVAVEDSLCYRFEEESECFTKKDCMWNEDARECIFIPTLPPVVVASPSLSPSTFQITTYFPSNLPSSSNDDDVVTIFDEPVFLSDAPTLFDSEVVILPVHREYYWLIATCALTIFIVLCAASLHYFRVATKKRTGIRNVRLVQSGLILIALGLFAFASNNNIALLVFTTFSALYCILLGIVRKQVNRGWELGLFCCTPLIATQIPYNNAWMMTAAVLIEVSFGGLELVCFGWFQLEDELLETMHMKDVYEGVMRISSLVCGILLVVVFEQGNFVHGILSVIMQVLCCCSMVPKFKWMTVYLDAVGISTAMALGCTVSELGFALGHVFFWACAAGVQRSPSLVIEGKTGVPSQLHLPTSKVLPPPSSPSSSIPISSPPRTRITRDGMPSTERKRRSERSSEKSRKHLELALV